MRDQVAKRRARLKTVIGAAEHNTGAVATAAVSGKVSERWTDSTWAPPPLLALTNADQFWSEWTWTGDVDRFELVKSLRRSANRHGRPLSEQELEYAVLTVEAAEECMVHSKFREALAMLTEVVELCPSFTLGYYKVALVLLALGGPSAIAQARHPFRCAARLEPDNSILRGNIDLTLRVIMGMPTQDSLWTAEYPKSQGDILALAACVMASESYKQRLASANRESKRKQAAAAAEQRMRSKLP